MQDFDIKDIDRRMNSAIDVLRKEFAGLRTGRASTSLLEPITVDAYGSQMPLTQVGTSQPSNLGMTEGLAQGWAWLAEIWPPFANDVSSPGPSRRSSTVTS